MLRVRVKEKSRKKKAFLSFLFFFAILGSFHPFFPNFQSIPFFATKNTVISISSKNERH